MTLAKLVLHSTSENPQQVFYEATNSNGALSARRFSMVEIESATGMLSVRLKRLHEEQELLIEKRNRLLDQNFMSLTSRQQEQLDHLDKRLDSVESEMARIARQPSQIDIQAIEKTIEEREGWIQNMAKKIHSKD